MIDIFDILFIIVRLIIIYTTFRSINYIISYMNNTFLDFIDFVDSRKAFYR